MARYKKAHSELVRAEYEFFDARDAANKEGKARPSTVIKQGKKNIFIWVNLAAVLCRVVGFLLGVG
jgi:hypothetical protein